MAGRFMAAAGSSGLVMGQAIKGGSEVFVLESMEMARSIEFDEEIAVRRAMEVSWEKGYQGASIRDLTDAMKIIPSSLYNTIGDKHKLFVRCVQRYTDDRKKYIERHTSTSISPLATITAFIDDAVTNITTGEHCCLAIKAAFEVAAEDQSVKAILQADSEDRYSFLCTTCQCHGQG